MGSVPCKMATVLQKDSAPCRNRTHFARLSMPVTSLNHSTIGLYQILEKTVYELSYYLNCFTLLFWVQNCQSQIAQVEYQG